MIQRADDEEIEGLCRGRTEVFQLGFDQERGWWCSCPVQGLCHHLIALQLVTAAPGSQQRAPASATESPEQPAVGDWENDAQAS